jgi:hypothetical protein
VRERPVRREVRDQLLERELLVRQRVHGGVPDPSEQLGKGRIVGQRHTQYESIREHADNRVKLGVAAACHLSTDQHVGLPRVARQRGHEAGEEHHEHGGIGAVRHRAQALGCRGVDIDRRKAATGGLADWPGPVGGQRKDLRRAAELLAPVAQLPVEFLATHAILLPHGEVAILHRQWRQRRGHTGRLGPVNGGQLVDQDLHGRSVADAVVHDQNEQVPVGPGDDQRHPDQRCGGQIERLAGQIHRDRLGLPDALVLVQPWRELDALDRHGAGVGDDLLRHTVNGDDARPQHCVPRDHGVHRALQRVRVELTLQPERVRHVVRRFGGRELLEEPQPLLRERHREAHGDFTSGRPVVR